MAIFFSCRRNTSHASNDPVSWSCARQTTFLLQVLWTLVGKPGLWWLAAFC